MSKEEKPIAELAIMWRHKFSKVMNMMKLLICGALEF
jgi:hypothetical protein